MQQEDNISNLENNQVESELEVVPKKRNKTRILLFILVGFISLLVILYSGFLLFVGTQKLRVEEQIIPDGMTVEEYQNINSENLVEDSNQDMRKLQTETNSMSYLEFLRMPNQGKVIEICDYPWDEELESPRIQHVECLVFHKDGNIEKTLDGKQVSTNFAKPSEEKKEISSNVQAFYKELLTEEYIMTLEQLTIPIAGGGNSRIILYSLLGSDRQEVKTTFWWDYTFGVKGDRFEEVFEHLKSYSDI